MASGGEFARQAPVGSSRLDLSDGRPGRLYLDRRTLLKSASATSVLVPELAKAALPERKLNFLVVGDWGRHGHPYQRHVAVQMGRLADTIGSRFTVSTGDNFYELGVSSTDDPQWRSSFEDVYVADRLLKTPWYAVLGNHDYGGNIAAQIAYSDLSTRWRMKNRWFDVPPQETGRSDTHLYFLDTIAWRGRESLPFSVLGSGVTAQDAADQRAWLIKALKSDARHKVVFGHYPIYSVGPHGGHGPDKSMADLDTLLRDNGVTAYVCGHDHCLYYIEHQGMHYVCSGGGSQELHRYTGVPKKPGCVLAAGCGHEPDPKWYYYIDKAGFAAFSVCGSGIDFAFFDRDGLMTPFAHLARPSATPVR